MMPKALDFGSASPAPPAVKRVPVPGALLFASVPSTSLASRPPQVVPRPSQFEQRKNQHLIDRFIASASVACDVQRIARQFEQLIPVVESTWMTWGTKQAEEVRHVVERVNACSASFIALSVSDNIAGSLSALSNTNKPLWEKLVSKKPQTFVPALKSAYALIPQIKNEVTELRKDVIEAQQNCVLKAVSLSVTHDEIGPSAPPEIDRIASTRRTMLMQSTMLIMRAMCDLDELDKSLTTSYMQIEQLINVTIPAVAR